MSLRSAQDDFEVRSLGAIRGSLAKLRYIAELHDGRGGYSHWGMGRVHGVDAARRAIRAAHATVLTTVLRTPLSDLAKDLSSSAAAASLSSEEFLKLLEQQTPRILPHPSVLASQKHLRVVLHALAALLQGQPHANRPGASRPLPPVQ